MTADEITALIITSALGLIFLIMSIFLLTGRGSFLVAGYNTMSKADKEKYNTKALCKFVGAILLPFAILTPLISAAAIFGISWFAYAYIAAVAALVIFAAVYANTNNRFKK